MGEYFLDSEEVKIEFPDQNWVTVKEELTQEDQDYVLSAMVRGDNEKVQYSLGKMALLERAIVSWSFPEPVNRENISRLRTKYRKVILPELDKLAAAANEFLTKN